MTIEKLITRIDEVDQENCENKKAIAFAWVGNSNSYS